MTGIRALMIGFAVALAAVGLSNIGMDVWSGLDWEVEAKQMASNALSSGLWILFFTAVVVYLAKKV